MKSLLPLCLLVAIRIEFGEAGLAFKAGLVKGGISTPSFLLLSTHSHFTYDEKSFTVMSFGGYLH